jgi:16S rRNA processing protein RimM
MDVLVGRIGRPHGVRGEVTVQVHTDDPDSRFAAGSVLVTEPAEAGPLTIAGSRLSGGVMVIAFEGFDDRSVAERLRGTQLLVDTDDLPDIGDPEEFYDHQLIGLAVRGPSGEQLGSITDVLHPPAAPVLEVRTPAGDAVLVPFVTAIVPEVRPADGYLVVDPPEGLFGTDPAE